MQNKFSGNYIKRISYYVGIIAFVAYLVITLIMWLIDTSKEADNIASKAKANLSPFIEWYKKDSTKERETIENLSKEEFDKLDINSMIHQNLQDIKTIIDNVEVLSRFILPYGDENGARRFSYDGARAALMGKTKVIVSLLWKEMALNPKNPGYIILDKERYKDFQDFLAFLKSHIDSMDSIRLEKASLDRAITNDMHIYGYSVAIIGLLLGDIEEHTCDIDKNIIENIISQYRYIQKNAKIFADYFDKKVASSDWDEESKKELEINNVEFKTMLNKELVIDAIKANLKECK